MGQMNEVQAHIDLPFEVTERQRAIVEMGWGDVIQCMGRNPTSYEEFDAHLCQCRNCREAYYHLFAAF